MLPTASSFQGFFDDEDAGLTGVDHPEYGAIRLPDGRALAWAEYGSPRGVPCILLPDTGSSRLAPGWLLHDSALPSRVRLLALDRPGTGASDAIGLGGHDDPAADLASLVQTLAVGRVAVIGIGRGADEAFDFARRAPHLVASVTAVSVRLLQDRAAPRRRRFRRVTPPAHSALGGWTTAVGTDLRSEQAWEQALPALRPELEALLGERWREADFRAAVAADAAQSGSAWAGVGLAPIALDWQADPDAIEVPVRLWHGRAEHPTSLAEVERLLADRPTWQLSAVAGPSATLGCWPQILAVAAGSFSTLSGV